MYFFSSQRVWSCANSDWKEREGSGETQAARTAGRRNAKHFRCRSSSCLHCRQPVTSACRLYKCQQERQWAASGRDRRAPSSAQQPSWSDCGGTRGSRWLFCARLCRWAFLIQQNEIIGELLIVVSRKFLSCIYSLVAPRSTTFLCLIGFNIRVKVHLYLSRTLNLSPNYSVDVRFIESVNKKMEWSHDSLHDGVSSTLKRVTVTTCPLPLRYAHQLTVGAYVLFHCFPVRLFYLFLIFAWFCCNLLLCVCVCVCDPSGLVPGV